MPELLLLTADANINHRTKVSLPPLLGPLGHPVSTPTRDGAAVLAQIRGQVFLADQEVFGMQGLNRLPTVRATGAGRISANSTR